MKYFRNGLCNNGSQPVQPHINQLIAGMFIAFIKKNIYIFLALSLLCVCQYVRAYTLRPIIDKEGLSNSCVLSLYQDHSGLLWMGTIDGISSYNGRNVRPFLFDKNKKGLSGSLINNIIETDDGIIWAFNYYGLDKLDKYNNQSTFFQKPCL